MSEQFYDDEIAPVLLELAHKCKERGVPFFSVVEYAPGDFGTTQILLDQSHTMLMTYMAQQCHGNIDKLVISWARYVREAGIPHGSIYLKEAGVPLKPVPRP